MFDPKRSFLALILVGVVLRMAPTWLPFEFAGPDTVSYWEPAARWASGLGFTEADGSACVARPPGYAAFLALVFSAAGEASAFAVRLAQALLGAAAAPVGYAVLRGVVRERIAWWGAWWICVDPLAIGQSPFLLREALLLAGVTALVGILGCWRGRARYLGAGLVLAGLTLTHQLYALLGPCVALADMARGRDWRARLRRARPWVGAGVLVVLAVVLWARRNERVTGHLTLTLSGNTAPAHELWLTTEYSNRWLSGDLDTGFQALKWREEEALIAAEGVEGAKAELYRRAWENARAHPLRTAWRAVRLNLWYWAEIPGAVRLAEHPRLRVVRWGLLPFHWVRLTCVLAGVWWLVRSGRWRERPEWLGIAVFFVVPFAPLYPVPRYWGPMSPLLGVLAAVGWARSRGEEGP